MEPIPKTLEALSLLEDQGDYTVSLALDALATLAHEVVPDLVGLSLALRGEALREAGLTFTMTQSGTHVGSSLSLPFVHRGTVMGGVSLYAESTTAFFGRQSTLAAALGADPGDAVANADLGFWSQTRANSAPQQIREHDLIDRAIGFIASARDTDMEVAECLLRESANQARESVTDTAESLLQRKREVPDIRVLNEYERREHE